MNFTSSVRHFDCNQLINPSFDHIHYFHYELNNQWVYYYMYLYTLLGGNWASVLLEI